MKEMLVRYLCIFILCAKLVHSCPDKCDCSNHRETNCNGRNIKAFSYAFVAEISQSTRILDLTGNPRAFFEARTFKTLFNLEELRLERNNMTRVPAELQKFFPKLKKLHLKGNLIDDLPEDSTQIFRNIEVLDLRENKLTELNDRQFIAATKLQTLDLRFNNIQTIGHFAFEGTQRLRSLNFDGNSVKQLAPELLDGQENLEEFSAASNSIDRLPDTFFPANIRRIELQGNNIEYFGTQELNAIEGERSLDLNNNFLSGLGENFLELAKLFTRVDLQGNPIACTCSILELRNTMLARGDLISAHCDSPVAFRGEELANANSESLEECEICEGCVCLDDCSHRDKIITISVCVPLAVLLIVVLFFYIRKKNREGAFDWLGTQVCCFCTLVVFVCFCGLSLTIWIALFMYQEA